MIVIKHVLVSTNGSMEVVSVNEQGWMKEKLKTNMLSCKMFTTCIRYFYIYNHIIWKTCNMYMSENVKNK